MAVSWFNSPIPSSSSSSSFGCVFSVIIGQSKLGRKEEKSQVFFPQISRPQIMKAWRPAGTNNYTQFVKIPNFFKRRFHNEERRPDENDTKKCVEDRSEAAGLSEQVNLRHCKIDQGRGWSHRAEVCRKSSTFYYSNIRAVINFPFPRSTQNAFLTECRTSERGEKEPIWHMAKSPRYS